MSTPTLAQTQQLLWRLITAPKGVADGLARLDPAARAVAQALVRDRPGLAPVERLDVYADMYFYRLRDCLAEDFVAVHAVVGAAAFHNLITDYLLAHPPTHFSLRFAGAHLPAFLRGHELSARWPYAADLAELEWAIVDAFDAPDAAPLEAAALAAVPEACWPALRFALAPSVQLLTLEWPVHEVWRAVQAAEVLPQLGRGQTRLRVWRQDLRVFHRAIDAAEAAGLDALRDGAAFAEVCACIVEADADGAGASRALALLSAWITDGVLTGCTAPNA